MYLHIVLNTAMVQSQLLSSTIVVVIVLAVRRKYLYINIVICDLHLLDMRLIFQRRTWCKCDDVSFFHVLFSFVQLLNVTF